MRQIYSVWLQFQTRKRFVLPGVFLLLFHASGFAQRQCGTPLAIEQALQKNPKLAEKIQQMEVMSLNYANEKKWLRSPYGRQAVTIPVVVHIVLKDPSVVTDAQVRSQIAVLNEDYTDSNTDTSMVPDVWKSLIGDMQLNFCLAQRTPQGTPTNGIIRVTTTHETFSINDAASDVKHASTGGSDIWNPDKYLNIWICELGSTDLGVGTPPGLYPPDEDGVVIQYNAFGTVGNLQARFNKGRSATHEIGHYFNLLHPWNGSTCTPGDGVDDTPPQSKEVYNCPPFPYLADACTTTFPGIMFMNFMEYVDDGCMHFFSKGQIIRMQSILFGTRASLLSSDGCVPVNLLDRDARILRIQSPSGKICEGHIAPVITFENYGKDTLHTLKISYRANDGNTIRYQWKGNLAPLDSAQLVLPGSEAGFGQHVLTVFVSDPNNLTDQALGNDTGRISFHLDIPPALPFAEGFEETAYPPQGWVIRNPDQQFTWEKTTTASHGGKSSVVMRNLDYANNGAIDDLISPVFNIQNADSAFLFFYVAAGVQSDPRGTNQYWDTLKVLISQDCATSFGPLYKKWGRTLITDTVPTMQEFVPTASQWRRDSIDLSSYIGKGNFQLAFRNISNFENNIYLDDIQLITREVNPNLKREKILVVPNPTAGSLLVEFLEITPDLRGVAIYNSAGQLIARKNISEAINNHIQFDLANAANGVYFVKILYQNKSVTKKIIKQ